MRPPRSPEDRQPVKLRSRRLAVENSKWKVYLDEIEGSGVRVSDYIVLDATTRRRDFITGATVLPIFRGQIVLLRTYRHPMAEYGWEAARGFIDEGEEPAQAALRELREETGLSCAPERLAFLGLVAPEVSTFIAKAALFVAENCQLSSGQDQSEPGLGQISSFSLQDALALADSGEIKDVCTLIALYRYAYRHPNPSAAT